MAEKLYQQFKSKKESLNKVSKEDILAKYGSAAEKPPEDLQLLGGTEKYVEYDRMGRVVKGQVSDGKGGGRGALAAECRRARPPRGPCFRWFEAARVGGAGVRG